MMNFASLRNSSDFEKAVRQIFVAAVIWFLALLIFLVALSQRNYNSSKLAEAEKILNAATVVKAYNQPAVAGKTADSSLSSLSDIVNATGLADRVKRLDSIGNETVLQADRVYPDELGKLVSSISSCGMHVSSAEIKAAAVKDERLLSVVLSVGGVGK